MNYVSRNIEQKALLINRNFESVLSLLEKHAPDLKLKLGDIVNNDEFKICVTKTVSSMSRMSKYAKLIFDIKEVFETPDLVVDHTNIDKINSIGEYCPLSIILDNESISPYVKAHLLTMMHSRTSAHFNAEIGEEVFSKIDFSKLGFREIVNVMQLAWINEVSIEVDIDTLTMQRVINAAFNWAITEPAFRKRFILISDEYLISQIKKNYKALDENFVEKCKTRKYSPAHSACHMKINNAIDEALKLSYMNIISDRMSEIDTILQNKLKLNSKVIIVPTIGIIE